MSIGQLALAAGSGLAGVTVAELFRLLNRKSDRRDRLAVRDLDEFDDAARSIARAADSCLRWAGDIGAGYESQHPFETFELDDVNYAARHIIGGAVNDAVVGMLDQVRTMASRLEKARTPLKPSPGVGPTRWAEGEFMQDAIAIRRQTEAVHSALAAERVQRRTRSE